MLVLAFLAAGCTQEVRFLSDPPGARIVVNNQFIGRTPGAMFFKINMESTREQSYEIRAYPPPGVTELPAQYRFLPRWDQPPERMFFYFKPRATEP